MTKAEFIEKWKRHVAGVIVLGKAEARPLIKGHLREAHQVGAVVYNLAEEVNKLLGQIFDSMQPAKKTEPEKPESASLHSAQKTAPAAAANAASTNKRL